MKKSKIGFLGALLIAALAALLVSSSIATAAQYKSQRYRIVKRSRTYDMVRGHGKKLMVRKQHRYVQARGAFRYRVIKRVRKAVILRRVSPSTSINTAITSGAALPAGLTATASSSRKSYEPPAGNDGKPITRWAAGSKAYPQWWMVDLGEETDLTGVKTSWYNGDKRAYRYQIETSLDGVTFSTAADRSDNLLKGPNTDAFSTTARYVRIRVLGERVVGATAAISEVAVYADSDVPDEEPSETPTPTPTDTEPTEEPSETPTPTPTPTDTETPEPTPTEPAEPEAPQADRYVAKTGSDTNNGSATRPWRTIQKAASSVTPGQTVSVAAGTYNERVTIPSTAGGTASNTTEFIANGRVVVSQAFVINSSYTVLDGFEVTPGSSTITDNQRTVGQVQVAGNYNTLKNLYIHDLVRGTGITIAAGKTHNTIEGCTINAPRQGGIGSSNDKLGPSYTTVRDTTVSKWAGEVGIDTVGDHWTVENCTLRGVTASDYQNPATQNGDGVWTNNSRSNVIRNTRIYDIWSHNGFAYQHADCIQMWTKCTGLLVENCTLGSWKPGGAENTPGPTMGIMFGTVSDGSTCEVTVRNSLFLTGVAANTHPTATGCTNGSKLNITLINNTFFSNFPELHHVTSLNAYNNIFLSHRGYSGGTISANHNAFLWNNWEGGTSSVYSGEGANSLGRTFATRLKAADIFVNPDVSAATNYGLEADFRPKPGSPLIGAGNPTYAPTIGASQ